MPIASSLLEISIVINYSSDSQVYQIHWYSLQVGHLPVLSWPQSQPHHFPEIFRPPWNLLWLPFLHSSSLSVPLCPPLPPHPSWILSVWSLPHSSPSGKRSGMGEDSWGASDFISLSLLVFIRWRKSSYFIGLVWTKRDNECSAQWLALHNLICSCFNRIIIIIIIISPEMTSFFKLLLYSVPHSLSYIHCFPFLLDCVFNIYYNTYCEHFT